MTDKLTITEAALLYGCTRTNMAYLVATNRLPSERIGKFIVLNRSDVVALREARDSRVHSNERIEGVHHGAA